ncbi:diguanylate cyclase domain-containing protein [Methylopila turkensis]|uniref:Diguanylate cyclase n=1 Tax=Methylopila turkensis TaxID=1437816 RepID=A0A9W6JMC2_9HYPH|nr:diguanylate cyclase [Methylopila turkensis]GLK80265.1 hypothetical protein GCM10008174_20060 [Methylopila turkensis]
MQHRLPRIVVFALVYGVVAYLTMRFGRAAGVSAVIWPAGALAIGMMVAFAQRSAVEMASAVAIVAIVNCVGHLVVGDPVWVSLTLGAANGVALAAALWMFELAGVSRDQPTRIRSVIALFVIAAFSTLPGAAIGGVTISLWRGEPPTPFVLSWWLTHFVSLLILVPPFLFWRDREGRAAAREAASATPEGRRQRQRRGLEIVLAAAALTVAGLMVPLTGETVLLELSATMLLWFGLRFGMLVTAVSIAIYSVCVVAAALMGVWPGAERGVAEILLPLQATLALTTLPSLVVAAIMSQRERARRQLATDARRLGYALEGANDGLWDWDLRTGKTFFSARYHRMLGFEPDGCPPGRLSWAQLMHPDDLPHATRAFEDHAAGRTPFYESEMRFKRRDGRWIWVLDRGKVVERDAEGAALRAVGTLTDISERKELERALEHLATHDTLTGLANRGAFERGMARAAARLDRQGGRVGVLLIDLDHFKSVNDTHGHPAGDALLLATGVRLRGAARTDDLVARLGGDEFAVVATGQSAAEFDALAARLCETLAAPVIGDGFTVTPSVSIGVAVATASSQVGDKLVQRADRALYAAKSAGRGTWRFFGGASNVA